MLFDVPFQDAMFVWVIRYRVMRTIGRSSEDNISGVLYSDSESFLKLRNWISYQATECLTQHGKLVFTIQNMLPKCVNNRDVYVC
jgi:Trm5-related predicted tRNA methylase